MSIKLSRVDPAQNMARFYEIDVQPGLFGDVSVIRHWGRIGAQGQAMETWYPDEDRASGMADRLHRQKLRRGYQALPCPSTTG